MAQILVHSVLSMQYNIITKDNSFWSKFFFDILSWALNVSGSDEINTNLGQAECG